MEHEEHEEVRRRIEEDDEKAPRTKRKQLRNFPAPWGEFGALFTQSFATLKRSRDFCLAKGWMRQQLFGTWTKRWMLVNVELVSFPSDLLLNRSFRKALVSQWSIQYHARRHVPCPSLSCKMLDICQHISSSTVCKRNGHKWTIYWNKLGKNHGNSETKKKVFQIVSSQLLWATSGGPLYNCQPVKLYEASLKRRYRNSQNLIPTQVRLYCKLSGTQILLNWWYKKSWKWIFNLRPSQASPSRARLSNSSSTHLMRWSAHRIT